MYNQNSKKNGSRIVAEKIANKAENAESQASVYSTYTKTESKATETESKATEPVECKHKRRQHGFRTGEPTGRIGLIAFLVLCLLLFLVAIGSSSSRADTIATLLPHSDTIEFSEQEPGVTASRQIVLTHTGDAASAALEIQSIFLDELDEKSFRSNFRGPAIVFPGDSYTIEIEFTPRKTGKTVGSLFINHSGAGGVEHIILSGTGTGNNTNQLTEKTELPAITSRAAPAFGKSQLSGIGNITPTSLQFGPDGRLYAADLSGQIKIYTVQRNGENQYAVTAVETLNQIKNIPNHNDNGSANNSLGKRLVTGILVTGTANSPVIYVNSSDPRIGGGASGNSTNLDTNSTIISRLTKNGGGWQKLDLVRGLPRSEENHHANGLSLNANGTKLYVAMGGNTNQGATSNNFALLPEYALSAAILEIDLVQIGNSTYDLPTLNDENRAGANDANDPFGGNRGKNQAKLVPGGPVQVYAPGFRNPYDIVITQSGKMYTWDNGPNAGWGSTPQGNGSQGVCSNGVKEPGNTHFDALHHISGPGYYGGHANPTRGNNNNKFNNSNPQSPVPFSNPVECDYRGASGPGTGKHPQNGSLTDLTASTNGLVEFTAGNFSGAMQGNLLAAAFDNKIYRVQLNASGTGVVSNTPLFSNVGQIPLDVTAVGNNGPFPGTIWVADFSQKSIIVFEPNDYQGNTNNNSCNANPSNGDSDQDGFSNADENANNTDPCSAADIPSDADGDFTSDLLDPDDDNDGIDDLVDPFALDEFNGANTPLGSLYDWENNSPAAPFIANLGFSGLLTNGSTNYRDQFDLSQMTISGAAGVVTVDNVTNGDPINGLNTQEYGFQFGVDVNTASPVFRAHTRILAPFAGINPQPHQSMGLFIGKGDQDNYIKLTVNSQGSQGGLQFAREVNGSFNSSDAAQAAIYGSDAVDLYIEVHPATQTAKAFYQITDNGQSGPMQTFGTLVTFPASWLTGNTKLAVGIISTSIGAPSFSATWDLIEVIPMFNGGGGTTNLPPIVNAGSDQSITLPASATLSGSVSDDGLPAPANLSTSWNLVAGPGTVTMANPNVLSTNLSFSAAGTYTLQLSASDGQLTQTDNVIFFVGGSSGTGGGGNGGNSGNGNGGNNAPANFVAIEVENHSSNVPAGNHSWVPTSFAGFSGTGGMVTTPNNGTLKAGAAGSPMLAYPVSFPAAGTYYVWVRGLGDTNGAGEGKNDSVHVGLNGALAASADKIDIFPAGAWNWTNSTRDSSVATLTVPSAGAHTVNLWMREDGLALDKLEFTTDITYTPSGIGSTGNSGGNGNGNGGSNGGGTTTTNLAPTVNAGTNSSTTVGIAITLTGSVSDDGLPASGTLTSSWTMTNGGGTATFGNAANPTTSVTFSAAGTYTLELAASDGALSSTDSLIVTVTAASGGNGGGTGGGSGNGGGGTGNTQTPIRINAGGPQVVANGNTWIADNPGSHGYVNTGFAHPWSTNVSTAGLPTGTPSTLFKSERWDAGAAPAMQWDIPLQAGNYDVRLYFSENFAPAKTTGGRIFSIEIEGNVVESNLDVFSQVGADTGLMKSYSISSDTNLDINFIHGTQNPAIKAIEILPVSNSGGNGGGNSGGGTTPVNTAPVVDAGANSSATAGTALSLIGLVSDDGLPATGSLTSIWSMTSGSGTANFGNPTSPISSVNFSAAGTYTLELTASDGTLTSTDSLTVTVTADSSGNGGGGGTGGGTVNTQTPIRINAGGPQIVANGTTWIADNPGSHGYVNTGFIHPYNFNISLANIPAGIPMSLFQTERWDANAGPEMQWNIPVQPGNYEVRLYFAENHTPSQTVGGRVFSIAIEGATVATGVDVFANVGARAAMVESFNVSSDGSLDIEFLHITQNPAIKAIEILPL